MLHIHVTQLLVCVTQSTQYHIGPTFDLTVQLTVKASLV